MISKVWHGGMGGGGTSTALRQDKSREVRPGRTAEEGRKISTLVRGAFYSAACMLKNMKHNQYSAHLASLGRLPATLSVLGRDDEPKMIPVIPAALREGPLVGRVGAHVEHPGVGAIVGDAFALERADMFGQRRRPEAGPAMADDPAHDDDPTTRGLLRQTERRSAAPAEGGAPTIADRLPEPLAGVSGLLGGAHDLTDKACRIAAVADAAGLDAEVVVTFSHGSPQAVSKRSDGAFTVENTVLLPGSASRSSVATCKTVNPTNHMRPTDGGAFILP
jgi:hypothetical protein